jgi:hypothetical protein
MPQRPAFTASTRRPLRFGGEFISFRNSIQSKHFSTAIVLGNVNQ